MSRKILRLCLMLTIAASLFLVAPIAMAEEYYDDLPGQEVRILLYGSSTASSYSITIGSGEYDIVEINYPRNVLATVSGGTVVFDYLGTNSYQASVNGETISAASALMAVPTRSDDYFVYNGTAYRGSFKAMHSGSYYYAINQVNIELYLYGVVGREIGYSYSMDAIKAQAVAARSYAMASYSANNIYYDMTNTTSSQVYGGKAAESDKIIEAVDDTCGMLLMYKGNYVLTYYSSNMGGHTENIENVWMSDAVPIKGVPSPHDSKAGNYGSYGASTYSWVVEYTPAQMQTLANSYGNTDIGTYQGIEFSTSLNGVESVSGRLMSVTIKGSRGSVTAQKDNIRSLLNLKSTLAVIDDTVNSKVGVYVGGAGNQVVGITSIDELHVKDSETAATMSANGDEKSFYAIGADGKTVEISKTAKQGSTVIISGKGYGHGVGLSQFGAIAMGDEGYTWQEIIEHYFCDGTGIKLIEDY